MEKTIDQQCADLASDQLDELIGMGPSYRVPPDQTIALAILFVGNRLAAKLDHLIEAVNHIPGPSDS